VRRKPFNSVQSLIRNAVPDIKWYMDEVEEAFADFDRDVMLYKDLMLGMNFKLVVEEVYQKACGFVHQSENYRIVILRGFAEDDRHYDWSASLEMRYSNVTLKPMRDPDLITLLRKFMPAVSELTVQIATSFMEPYTVSDAVIQTLDEENIH